MYILFIYIKEISYICFRKNTKSIYKNGDNNIYNKAHFWKEKAIFSLPNPLIGGDTLRTGGIYILYLKGAFLSFG